MIIGAAESILPFFRHHLVGEVVVSRDEEEPHTQRSDLLFEGLPLLVHNILIVSVSVYQIAHAENKLRIHQVDLFDGLFKDTRTVPAMNISDDSKLKIIGII